jgi:hypothetical protein
MTKATGDYLYSLYFASPVVHPNSPADWTHIVEVGNVQKWRCG